MARTPTPRNVITKLDDLGLYADIIRGHGESVTNFRSRVLRAQAMKGGANFRRLTDAICNELGLGQTHLMTITALFNEIEVEITEVALTVSFSGVVTKEIPLVVLDPDGVWTVPSISGVVSGLQNVSGIQAQVIQGYGDLPAFLLEPQGSNIQIVNEQVPRTNSFYLAVLGTGDQPAGPVLSGSVSFNDTDTFRTQVFANTPQGDGEWSCDELGRVNVFTVPNDIVLATYKYTLLGSGMTMGLIGNGARIFNLANEDVQELLWNVSGVTAQAKDFLYDVRSTDRNFWGK